MRAFWEMGCVPDEHASVDSVEGKARDQRVCPISSGLACEEGGKGEREGGSLYVPCPTCPTAPQGHTEGATHEYIDEGADGKSCIENPLFAVGL
jgi:hypothetical protein